MVYDGFAELVIRQRGVADNGFVTTSFNAAEFYANKKSKPW